jgi:hypothetical protein
MNINSLLPVPKRVCFIILFHGFRGPLAPGSIIEASFSIDGVEMTVK